MQQITAAHFHARRGYNAFNTSVVGTNIEIHNNGLPGKGEI